MESQGLRPVRGTWTVGSDFDFDKPDFPHEVGFRKALQNALDTVTENGWPPGTYEDVQVEFLAKVEVVNPGHIIEYAAVLTPPGG